MHLFEIGIISKPKWKEDLSSLIVKISKNHTLEPNWGLILEWEIRNLVLRELGEPTINIRKKIHGKGLIKLIGAIPKVISNDVDSSILDDLNKQLLDKLNSPEVMGVILKLGFDEDDVPILKRGLPEAVKKLESIRKSFQNIRDNELRRKKYLFENISAFLNPIISKTLIEMNLPKEFAKRIFSRIFDVDNFLERIPTALCLFSLLFQRDQQLQRPIKVNDMVDVWFLAEAIPYCDIVVTEKMWTSIAKGAKLDIKCNTIILSSIKELGNFL